MPRTARKKSESGVYHVMLRGANGNYIFSQNEDCLKFLDILSMTREKSCFSLYTWCLMGNHVHLLLKENDESISVIFKRLEVSYANYYNHSHGLRGHLFQDRFRSEAINSDAYFYDVLKYICQNPVKAKLVKNPFDYKWLGCAGINDLLPTDSIESLTHMTTQEIIAFVTQKPRSNHLDDKYKRLTDEEASIKLCYIGKYKNPQEISVWKKEVQDALIINAVKNGISIRQLARISPLKKSSIEKTLKMNYQKS